MIEYRHHNKCCCPSAGKAAPCPTGAFYFIEREIMMDLNTYMYITRETAVYPKEYALLYTALGLTNESGEVAGKLKKILRGDKVDDSMLTYGSVLMTEEQREALLAELGDVLWYLARVIDELDYTLEDVARDNVKKLFARKEKNTLKGDGDNR